MKSIQNYFRNAKDRAKFGLDKPTDVELEILAQTWSEHCKHKIFSAEVEYLDRTTGKKETFTSLYKTFIQKGTKEIAKKVDWLVSVFTDNAGVIKSTTSWIWCSRSRRTTVPSALDPYGGAMTGIVGVNRDPLGTGQGADLLINVWGYCLGSPFTDPKDVPEGLLHPRRLRDGVHKGVIDGGNQSGIPTESAGSGSMNATSASRWCTAERSEPCENGRQGGGMDQNDQAGRPHCHDRRTDRKDGIHGATFSSEELHKDSPVQAVQIGDPITQKKMSDFIYEIRDRNLYRFVTDNGAGGLSSSVGEMASISNGCRMDLAKGSSEICRTQTLGDSRFGGAGTHEFRGSSGEHRGVPPRGEGARCGSNRAREFTDDGKFCMPLRRQGGGVSGHCISCTRGCPGCICAQPGSRKSLTIPIFPAAASRRMCFPCCSVLNICSGEYKARQYDHEVKGLSVIKPYTGVKRDVASDATVYMVEPLGREGVVLSAGIMPRYSDIDTYHMMASTMDVAIREAVAVGADPTHLAGLDNFLLAGSRSE